jgi:hypothetical protein
MAAAAAKTPGMSGRILPKVVDSLAKWQQATATPDNGDGTNGPSTTFDEDPVTGARFAGRGKLLLPSGYDSNVVQASGPMTDPSGKFLWSKDKWVSLKEQGYPEGSSIKTVNGVNVIVDPTGKRILHTLGTASPTQALAGILGDNTNAPAATTPSKGPVTQDMAKTYLKAAGGDKDKARQMATSDGYSF